MMMMMVIAVLMMIIVMMIIILLVVVMIVVVVVIVVMIVVRTVVVVVVVAGEIPGWRMLPLMVGIVIGMRMRMLMMIATAVVVMVHQWPIGAGQRRHRAHLAAVAAVVREHQLFAVGVRHATVFAHDGRIECDAGQQERLCRTAVADELR